MQRVIVSALRISKIARALLFTAVITPVAICAQDSSSYKMEFVRAAMVRAGEESMLVAVLKVTPIVPDFKLVLSMKLSYDLGDGERSMDIQQSPDIRFTVYGADVESKSKKVYAFVKDKVDLNKEKDIFLLRIDFRGLPPDGVKDMWLKYGLWEGENDEIRHEQEFRFAVEDLR
ncbi:MAG: hypothetical protein KA817_11870 [Flavobacteriales bacterium]|nr:hypothetical protein [Flavobacteriales bacterium]